MMMSTNTEPLPVIDRGADWAEGAVTSPDATVTERMGQVFGFAKGLHAIHLIRIGVELGLFEHLAGSASAREVAEIAASLGLQERYVQIWCETATGLELLDRDSDGRYRLAPGIESVLGDPSAPYYLGAFPAAHLEMTRDYAQAASHFRSGTTYQFAAHDVSFLESVANATAVLPRMFMDAVLPQLPDLRAALDDGARVLDLGCGAGFAVTHLAEEFPASSFVGVDVDPVSVGLAADRVEREQLGERVRVEAVDGSSLPPEMRGQFDLVTMFLVLHEVEPSLKAAVLSQCYEALRPGGRLLLFDERFPSSPDELRDPTLIFAVLAQWYEAMWGNEMQSRESDQGIA